MMKYDPELYSSDKRDFLNQELIFYKKLVKKRKPKRILELGVGNGRIFSKLLPHVEYGVGIDISPKMLRECKKECNNYANYKIYKMDFTNFVLPRGFDFIYMPFNTFHHILSYGGQLSCIKNVYSIMNEGAIFILDLVIIDIKKLNYNWKFDYKSRLNKKGVIMRYQRTKYFNRKKGIVVKEFRYEMYKNKSIKKIHMIVAHIKVIDFHKLERFIDKAGLKIIKKWGDYNFSDKLSNKKCILCLGKK